MNKQSDSEALTAQNLQMIVEIGKFCGRATSGIPSEDLHAAFHDLVRRIEGHFADEQRMMNLRGLGSKAHTALHSIILLELAELDKQLNHRGVALDMSQLRRLRQMFAGEDEQDEILDGRLQRDTAHT